MHDSTLDLFCQDGDDTFADEYAKEIELKAAELEVTVDYYMQEFLWCLLSRNLSIFNMLWRLLQLILLLRVNNLIIQE